ncbi:DMT family transporter [Nitrogeniibacter mangrovi]|uniref:DMT family transporter n=1 Tax=Nitrogeniibacter mangrovi TaxID=2016596 RepID=A0A6C1B2G0_9RHOO|nr:DMT family transporter [Nitrogeniibacter mangrovi]QID17826.1 DMT family transporter [Nitrogeniibacter mangrovi]
MRRLFDSPYLLLTLTALFWAGNMVLGRSIRADVPPIALAFWRWTLALMLMLPLALPHWRTQRQALRAGWKPIVLLGALGVGGYNTFAYLALQYTTAINATMLNSLIPVATILLARVLIGRHLHRLEAIGVLVSLLGVSVIVSHGQLGTLLGLKLNPGDFWMLVAVLDWGLYTVALHWRPKGVDPMLMLAAMTVVGILILGPLWAWEMSHGRFIVVSLPSVAGMLYTAIFPGFLGYIFYNRGVAMVGPNRGSLFLHLMPAFGTVLSMIFLGENPKGFHAAGIALILCGIWMTTRARATS